MNCTGCAACANVCSKAAISMEEDAEGFYYPYIDGEKCVSCGLCVKVCPSNHDTESYPARFYMGWHKDGDVVKNSSSGGAFTALCEYAFRKNGVVFGVTKDPETWEVRHEAAHNLDEICGMRGSKYYQSNPGTVYKQVKVLLENNVFVLFTGTACQIAALRSVVGERKVEHLLTVDVLCHGCASGKAVKCYIKDQEKKYKKKVRDFKFRTKDVPWQAGGGTQMKLDFSDGTTRIEDRNFDTFFVGFNNNLLLRESCYRCKYCGRERVADITIADYWGVKANAVPPERLRTGVSLIMANSEKGKDVLGAIGDSFYYEEIEPTIAVAHNQALTKPNCRHKERNRFYCMMDKRGFNSSVKRLLPKYYAIVNLRKILIYIFGARTFECVRKVTRRKR